MKTIEEQGAASIFDVPAVYTFWDEIVNDMVGEFDTAEDIINEIEIEFGFEYNIENVEDCFDWGRREAIRAMAETSVEDYQEFSFGYDGIHEGAEYWVKVINEMVTDKSRRYEAIEHIVQRIYESSDWMENGFTERQVDGMIAAIRGMVEAAWKVSDRV